MSGDEILTGLNNALSRGESLENAKKALAMAGYNQQEIEDNAHQVNMGVIGTLPEEKNNTPDYKPLPKTEIQKDNPIIPSTEKKKFPKIIIFLIIILAILILGLTFFILFGETILKAMFGK